MKVSSNSEIIWAAIAALGVWSGLLSGFFVFITKAIVTTEIKKLNGTYRRTPECQLIMQPMMEKLNHIEIKLENHLEESH